MEGGWQIVGLSIGAFLNYALAFIVSIEIAERDLLSFREKLSWNVFTWLVPVIGPFFTHRHLRIGWAKGSGSGGGNGIVPPGDSGSC